MRDNHEGMPEIVETFEEGGNAFAVIAVEREGRNLKFRIGVSPAAHHALKRMFQFRPFENSPGMKYRYFYAGSVAATESPHCKIGVRVESGNAGKNFDFDVPKELVRNLVWFLKTKDLSEADNLRIE
jgi:hypothetical protein